ncbi:hypothetical protein EVAR_94309_1 [Eumeta japonica]|uniref:Uncharacterized protein n=1 Tax=Eumeta variegata TaxID=151549 RepID=A0A4C1UGG8_EUMVA|nr:hypothetical protein EVAR_94309_1 [Eumeta japonica]
MKDSKFDITSFNGHVGFPMMIVTALARTMFGAVRITKTQLKNGMCSLSQIKTRLQLEVIADWCDSNEIEIIASISTYPTKYPQKRHSLPHFRSEHFALVRRYTILYYPNSSKDAAAAYFRRWSWGTSRPVDRARDYGRRAARALGDAPSRS